ncbi:MAG: galactose-1-phosphate uridyl transferase [Chrysothrix sp. TS-e1954]|nr:MAG: galactose-1-phosphate uridyl transferase [Chrysothrix sp. TS-e1954]
MAQEAPSKSTLPDYDADCYLCPGNKRAQGDANPQYENTYVFVNDYSAVKETQADYYPDHEAGSLAARLLQTEPVKGKCFVITFSRSHNTTLADLTTAQILPIIQTWTDIYASHVSPSSPLAKLVEPTAIAPHGPGADPTSPATQLRYMQIFENKGAAMGCSNPHPHGQVWTTTSLPEEPAVELAKLREYRKHQGGKHMLEDYSSLESVQGERIVFENGTFLAVCPWWATWPFEVLVVSKLHKRALLDFTDEEKMALAQTLSEITRRYDNLFETQFPYSMGLHQAPLEGTPEEIEASHFHIHFYPPLLRSATVRKFLVGYEMLGEPQRDITPEQAAKRLRDCGGELYRQKLS